MLKITKPFMYANFTTINGHIIRDEKFLSLIKIDFNKIRKIPKNVLRFKFIKIDFGHNNDDFIHDRFTLRATFEIIKFKR